MSVKLYVTRMKPTVFRHIWNLVVGVHGEWTVKVGDFHTLQHYRLLNSGDLQILARPDKKWITCTVTGKRNHLHSEVMERIALDLLEEAVRGTP